jgi:hypothetical protein
MRRESVVELLGVNMEGGCPEIGFHLQAPDDICCTSNKASVHISGVRKKMKIMRINYLRL